MNNYIKQFWEMKKSEQETLLKILYNLSNDNKNVFLIWEKKENEVLNNLINQIDKITFKENYTYKKKIKVSKINNIMKNAKAYPLSNNGLIKLYYNICINIINFIKNKNWGTLAIEKSCGRYINQYLDIIREIPEISERNEKKEEIINKLKILLVNKNYQYLNKFLLTLKK
jgi:hypothetical protein